MLQILKTHGIPTQLVDSFGKTYEETWANVLSPDSESEFSKITTSAPYLFIIVLNYVLREAIKGHEESLGLTIKQSQNRKSH